MLPNALLRISFPPAATPRAHLAAPVAARVLRCTLVFAAALLLPGAAARAQDSTAAKPAAPGVYTEEQAERGNGVFTKVCLECHTRNDMTGSDFRLNWNGRTVFELFERIRTTMPEAAPGSLTREEYADVTSYFLKLNGMPAGSMPMPADSTLASIKLELAPPPPSHLVLRHAPTRAGARPHGRLAPRIVTTASRSQHTALRPDHTLLFRGF